MSQILFVGDAVIFGSRIRSLQSASQVEEVVTAGTADEAMRAFVEKGPFDLLFISIELPVSQTIQSRFVNPKLDLAAGAELVREIRVLNGFVA